MDPGSDIANLAIMGYDPARYHTGRAPLEAAALGVDMGPREVAFRCNLVTLRFDPDGIFMEDYSAGHISSEEARELIQVLDSALGREGRRLLTRGPATATCWYGPRQGGRPGAPIRPMTGAARKWATSWAGPPRPMGPDPGLLADPQGLRG